MNTGMSAQSQPPAGVRIRLGPHITVWVGVGLLALIAVFNFFIFEVLPAESLIWLGYGILVLIRQLIQLKGTDALRFDWRALLTSLPETALVVALLWVGFSPEDEGFWTDLASGGVAVVLSLLGSFRRHP